MLKKSKRQLLLTPPHLFPTPHQKLITPETSLLEYLKESRVVGDW